MSYDKSLYDDSEVTSGELRAVQHSVVLATMLIMCVVGTTGWYLTELLAPETPLASVPFAFMAIPSLLIAYSMLVDGYVRRVVGLVFDFDTEPLASFKFGERSNPEVADD